MGTGSGSSRDNTHSQLNRYDALQRLIGTDVGVLQAASGGGLEIDPQSIVRADAWQLDLLGNWIGGAEAGNQGVPGSIGGTGAPTPPTGVPDEGGRITWGQLDAGIPGQTPGSSPLFATWAHAVNMQNEIRAVSTVAGEASNPPSTADIKFVQRDANGNLICDGTYYYQYDAWNRLLQISRAVITTTTPGTPGPGEPEPLEGELSFTAEPGDLVKHYTYDGLGRLIRTQSPWPNIDDGAQTGEVRSERFYYDGIRRIQEVVTDPLLSIGLAMAGEGGGELQQIAEEAGEAEEVDSKAATLGLEEGQNALQGGGSPAPVIYTYVAREYVWGTGDGHAGPDELLVQYGPTRAAWWTLQDAGGDVVAVCDLSGSGGTARVCGQWRYDAYGAATAAEHLHAFPTVRCGHKALFFDRLDSASADNLGNEPPRLIPFAHLVVQMRNRAYMPQLGRFLQPDPNATALTLIEATSYHGRGMGALVAAFDVQGLYGDGMNLYEYLGSNPWMRADPLGLSWDPFSMVDEYLIEDAASKAAFLDRVIGGAQIYAYIGLSIASSLNIPVISNAAAVGAMFLEGEVSPEVALAGRILGMASLTHLAVSAARFSYHAGRSAIRYAQGHGTRGSLRNGPLTGRSNDWVARKRQLTSGDCGCFVAATLVWTPIGPVPISQLEVGDEVVARDERTGELSLQRVTATIVTHAAAVLDMHVRHADGRIEIIRTTDEHPFWVNGIGWVRADALTPGMGVSTLIRGDWQSPARKAGREEKDQTAVRPDPMAAAAIEAVEFTAEQRTVHNITVAGVSTYHVGSDGVLVHNCKHHIFPAFRGHPEHRRYFASRGIDVDQLAKDLPNDIHTAIHPRWNMEWLAYMAANPNATREDVFRQAAKMLKAYGIDDFPTVPYGRVTR